MSKFLIKTLGCKTNQVESALIAEILSDNGFVETENIEEADFYILNNGSLNDYEDRMLSILKEI